MSKITKIIVAVFVLALLIVPTVTIITFSNSEIGVKNRFEAVEKERSSFYSTMSTIIAQTTQIAVKNDESFKENIDVIMSGRKDGEQIMMKWITESNPNSNFSEVTKLYQNLQRVIEGKRTEFFEIERKLMDIEREHKDLTTTFPNSLYFNILGKEHIKYDPIQTVEGKQVIESGIETNTKLEL